MFELLSCASTGISLNDSSSKTPSSGSVEGLRCGRCSSGVPTTGIREGSRGGPHTNPLPKHRWRNQREGNRNVVRRELGPRYRTVDGGLQLNKVAMAKMAGCRRNEACRLTVRIVGRSTKRARGQLTAKDGQRKKRRGDDCVPDPVGCRLQILWYRAPVHPLTLVHVRSPAPARSLIAVSPLPIWAATPSSGSSTRCSSGCGPAHRSACR